MKNCIYLKKGTCEREGRTVGLGVASKSSQTNKLTQNSIWQCLVLCLNMNQTTEQNNCNLGCVKEGVGACRKNLPHDLNHQVMFYKGIRKIRPRFVKLEFLSRLNPVSCLRSGEHKKHYPDCAGCINIKIIICSTLQ